MLRTCSLATSPRIALLQQPATGSSAASCPGATSGGAGGEALLFELLQAAPSASALSGAIVSSFSAGIPNSGGSEDDEEVVASRLNMHNTLLGAAIVQQQALFVADLGKYMQVRGGHAHAHARAALPRQLQVKLSELTRRNAHAEA